MATFPASLADFQPQRLLGRGGFGEVWLARQTNLDRDVAIKVGLSPLTDSDSRQRFDRECKALGRLTNQRHIVDVYSSGFTTDGLPYLVMEYVAGGTLADRLGAMSEKELRLVTIQLCEGLQAAHDVGVLHRDLKPENIFLRENGEVVVGDFGIARLSELGVTAAGTIPATIAYAAPETLGGAAPMPTTDVYGIGVSVVTVVLGRSPFEVAGGNDSIPALLGRVISDPMPDFSHLVSHPFASALKQATAKEPTQRLQTAIQLRDLLTATTSETATAATSVAPQPGHYQPERYQPEHYGAQTVAAGSSPGPQQQLAPTLHRHQGAPSGPPQENNGQKFLIGILSLGALLIVGGLAMFAIFGGGSGTETDTSSQSSESAAGATAPQDNGDQSDISGSDIGGSDISSTTEAEPTTSTTEAKQPIFLPLQYDDYVATGLPPDGTVELEGSRADRAAFCNVRPSILGLDDAIADSYFPKEEDKANGVAFQRVMRFKDAEAAQDYVSSWVSTGSCGSWTEVGSDGAEQSRRIVPSSPSITWGDSTEQLDDLAETPGFTTVYSRTVVVRLDTDVVWINRLSQDPQIAKIGADLLAARAVEILEGYG